MKSPLKRVATLFVTPLVAVLLMVSVGLVPASAAPYTTQTTLSVSTQNPTQGAALTVTGKGYGPNETVTLTIGSVVVGRATTGADGSFAFVLTLPANLLGAQTIVGTGVTSGRSASALIVIAAVVAAGGAGGGNLASTGVAVMSIGLLAAVLLLGGGGLLVLSRRRRITHGRPRHGG